MYVFITTEKSAQNVAAETMPLNSWHKTQTERRLPLIPFVSVSVTMILWSYYSLLKPSEAPQRNVKVKICVIFSLCPGPRWEGLSSLTNFVPLVFFYTQWQHQKTWFYFFQGINKRTRDMKWFYCSRSYPISP